MVHFTKPENVAPIQETGFNYSRNSTHGKGVYFTNNDNPTTYKLYGSGKIEIELLPHNQLFIERDIDVPKILDKISGTHYDSSNLPEKMIEKGIGSVRYQMDNEFHVIVFDRSKIRIKQKHDSAYLEDVTNFIKLNYNCPDSEKIGSGPGSCGGSSGNEHKNITMFPGSSNNKYENGLEFYARLWKVDTEIYDMIKEKVEGSPEYNLFNKLGDKWLRNVDPEAREDAISVVQNNKLLKSYLLHEHFGLDVPEKTTLYRVGRAKTGMTNSFFPNRQVAEVYQKRMGVESIHEYEVPTNEVIPSLSGAGEIWVPGDVESIIEKQNSSYLADAFETIKLNYKCKAGTVDDSNKCELENSDVPETRTFHEENIKSKILSLNDSKYPKDAVFRSKSRSSMTKNVELDILNNDNHVKILSDNIDKLHYQCDNLKIPRLRGIVADKNTKAGLASMADGILAVTPDMFRNDPDSEVDLRLSRNQERLNYINNKLNLLESFIQSDKEKWTKNNPSLVNSGMKFEESTFYKTGYPWPKEINEYKSEKNNIMARINDLNTKKTNALIYTWKPGMPDSEKPFGASEYFPFDQSPKLLLDHEFGHHIHQLYGVKNAKSYATPPLEKKIDQIYKKSEKDGTLIVPSKYAASDHQEWFAESYSLYVNGRNDLVTPGLIDLFKKIGVKT